MKKRVLLALAALVGLGGLLAAPVSQAGVGVYHGRGPVHPHPGYRHRVVVRRSCHHGRCRRVVVRRWCRDGHCFVRRRVWVN